MEKTVEGTTGKSKVKVGVFSALYSESIDLNISVIDSEPRVTFTSSL